MGMEKHLSKSSQRSQPVKIISGRALGENFDVIRIQVEGLAGGGKSHFLLAIIRHMHEVLGLSLEQIKICIIDCDKRGIAPLLFSQVIPLKYQDCIEYAKCNTVFEAYEAYELFNKSLLEHEKETGVKGWMYIENMGALWYFCQRDYVEAAYHIEYVQMLIEKQEEAHARGKKTLPALDQMLDYRNINPLHNELANKITRGDYNSCWTAHTTTRKSQEGNNEVEKVVGGGQKDNDTRVDFILRLYNLKGRFLADSRKLRSLENNFNELVLTEKSFTVFIEKYHDMLTRDCKKRGVKIPDFYWVKKQSTDKAVQKDEEKPKPQKKPTEQPRKAKKETKEENDDEEIEL